MATNGGIYMTGFDPFEILYLIGQSNETIYFYDNDFAKTQTQTIPNSNKFLLFYLQS